MKHPEAMRRDAMQQDVRQQDLKQQGLKQRGKAEQGALAWCTSLVVRWASAREALRLYYRRAATWLQPIIFCRLHAARECEKGHLLTLRFLSLHLPFRHPLLLVTVLPSHILARHTTMWHVRLGFPLFAAPARVFA
ncbi:hypothetical protein [Achromobacter spanius]|uniref:hypothetical protein n=1 Tax=Achromobacter spanius TaxID=217203 RepID=UPI003F69205D